MTKASKRELLLNNVRRGNRFVRGDAAERRAIGRHYVLLPMMLFTPTIEVDDEEMRFLVHTKDRVITADMFAEQKAYEIEVMATAIDLASRLAGRDVMRGKCFVDVGANIGTSTVPALKRFGAARALCLEPEPENAKLLRCNLILNDLERAAHVVQTAVSDERGEVELLISRGNLGDHRVHLGGHRAADTVSWESTMVPARPLDDVLAESGVEAAEVGLLWIDTQGYEPHVLRSAAHLLDYGVPTVIEYWPSVLGESGLESLHDVITGSFSSFVDLRSPALRVQPSREVDSLTRDLSGSDKYTDLLLIPPAHHR